VRVSFRKSFVRDLRKLKDAKVRGRIREVIEAVEEADSLSDLPDVKKMSGSSGFYRIRIGSYRIGLMVERGVVEFVRVLDRKDIYTCFP
jgi:mRNA interferase RelE/StbE